MGGSKGGIKRRTLKEPTNKSKRIQGDHHHANNEQFNLANAKVVNPLDLERTLLCNIPQ